MPDSIATVWPAALVQACVLHLIRDTFRYASRKYFATSDARSHTPNPGQHDRSLWHSDSRT